MTKINKYGLCLEEYTHNTNNADIYYKRAIGKLPEMEVSKALAKLIKTKVKNRDHFYSKSVIKNSIKKEKRALATYIMGNEQVSGCLLQPHYFVIISK